MKYIELFAGVGGFRNGINKAHPDWQCVYSNEWDKYANECYRKHYGECDNRDIREVGEKDIPDHELLVGGFPCQSFSVAGKRGGFADTRGTLFFEIARILKEKQPRLLLLENVKGLLSHDQGRTFGVILTTLDELGYDVQWQVLNSKNFGVPQNRERVFIVGHLRGTPRPQVFPLGSANQKDIEQLNHPRHSNDRIYSEQGLAPTLNTMQGGRRQPFVAIPVLTPDRAEKRQNGRRFKTNGEPAFTLTQQDIHGVYDGVKIRRITPLETERLQGFPDDWTKYGVDYDKGLHIWRENIHELVPISDTQRYKMMGNAVTTNVITAIAERLI
jgi:DNA (cytosine-5)-methyltransferase 1